MAKSTIKDVLNNTGSTLSAGSVVYISGFDDSAKLSTVALADNRDESKMPAAGVVREDIESGESGVIKIGGLVSNFDTSSANINDDIFVGASGNISFSDPLGNNTVSQKIGVVSHVSEKPNGQIELIPLEFNRQIRHSELIDVFENQHIDHSIFSLINGTRAFTGPVSGISPTVSSHLTTKGYVDDKFVFTPNFSGGDGYVAFWTGSRTIAGDNDFFYDRATGKVGLGTISPSHNLHIKSSQDASIYLEADADNENENDQAWVKLSQDGGAFTSYFGTISGSNVDPEGNAFTGTTGNSTLLGIKDSVSLHLGTNNNVRMTIDSDGNIDMPVMQQWSSVTRTSDSNAITSDYNPFGTNNGGAITTNSSSGISFNSSTGVLTIGQTGTYEIFIILFLEQNNLAELDNFEITQNGGTLWNADVFIHSSVDPVERTAGGIFDLTASDTIEMRIDSNSTNTLAAQTGCTFNIKRIA